VPQKVEPQEAGTAKFVLFGEDDLDDQELLREVLMSLDDSLRLLFANTGDQVLSVLSKLETNQLPCLIVLDYNMPALNGADVLQRLNETRRYDSIPRVIWSTSGSESFKRVCLELGAVDYVIKPSNVREMKEVIRYMLSLCMV
jgi:CheY-like chemotaxis protein